MVLTIILLSLAVLLAGGVIFFAVYKNKTSKVRAEGTAEAVITVGNERQTEDLSEYSALKLENIVKVYGSGENQVRALKGVSLEFRSGEFVSVLGQSGCGKTTLLNIIGGLDRYTSGDLVIDGVSTKKYKDSDWDTYRNNCVGFVFQSYNLIQHQTVLANVEMALTLSGVGKKERHKRALAVLEKVGLKEQAYKKPNQMSGGQMQRVAIARALVNDPEIILADEPTGALDSETSIQVMELLKEVAKDRLVIMVTHNPELAKKYSTRIITLMDGEVKGDTRPFKGKTDPVKQKSAKKEKGKAQMRLGTALSLSMSNLRTKRGRTTLTSVAGSIGIIGIALVLAVSTGFSAYINKMQAETLSVYPLTISEATIDLTDFNKLLEKTGLENFPQVKKIYSREMFGNLTDMLKSNKLSDEYLSFVDAKVSTDNENALKGKDGWKYCVKRGYGFDVNNYIYSNIGYNLRAEGDVTYSVMPVDSIVQVLESMFNQGIKNSNMNISAEFVREYIPTVCELPDNINLLEMQYDLLQGEWAKNPDELMLVVNSYNQLSDITLALLGYKTIKSINAMTYKIEFDDVNEFSFDDALTKKFYYVNNDDRYTKISDGVYKDNSFTEDSMPASTTDLKIKGIIRIKEDVSEGVLDTGIAYTSGLIGKILETNKNSDIVVSAKSDSNAKKSVNVYGIFSVPSFSEPSSMNAKKLGGDDTVSKLSIYSVDYKAKEDMKTYLDEWNSREGREKEDEVHYSDSTAMLFSALNSIVDGVKIVLICFTAISLVVSSIMIGIITYVSVVERTKEIGVLRSIGARKKDISRIFNAETFIIGLLAGLIGVAVTYILSVPINLIVGGLINNIGNVASLKITDALILVCVSFALTLIAGLIPARIASEKDPVVALRTE